MTNNLLFVLTKASLKLAWVRYADRSFLVVNVTCEEQCEAVLAKSVETWDENEIVCLFFLNNCQ